VGGHRYTCLQLLRFPLQLTTLYSRTVMLHINISSEHREVSFPLDESGRLDNVDKKGIEGNTGVGREEVALSRRPHQSRDFIPWPICLRAY
jgi:hypothetical protein